MYLDVELLLLDPLNFFSNEESQMLFSVILCLSIGSIYPEPFRLNNFWDSKLYLYWITENMEIIFPKRLSIKSMLVKNLCRKPFSLNESERAFASALLVKLFLSCSKEPITRLIKSKFWFDISLLLIAMKLLIKLEILFNIITKNE